MIRSATGRDVQALLDSVRHRPDRFSMLTLCCPFVDEITAMVLAAMVVVAQPESLGVHVITTSASRTAIAMCLPGHPSQWVKTFSCPRSLHAKVYLARGRRPRDSVALVSSANLTQAGLTHNLEFGIAVRPTTAAGRQLFGEIVAFVNALAGASTIDRDFRSPRGITK